jgi:hypothetical protein
VASLVLALGVGHCDTTVESAMVMGIETEHAAMFCTAFRFSTEASFISGKRK